MTIWSSCYTCRRHAEAFAKENRELRVSDLGDLTASLQCADLLQNIGQLHQMATDCLHMQTENMHAIQSHAIQLCLQYGNARDVTAMTYGLMAFFGTVHKTVPCQSIQHFRDPACLHLMQHPMAWTYAVMVKRAVAGPAIACVDPENGKIQIRNTIGSCNSTGKWDMQKLMHGLTLGAAAPESVTRGAGADAPESVTLVAGAALGSGPTCHCPDRLTLGLRRHRLSCCWVVGGCKGCHLSCSPRLSRRLCLSCSHESREDASAERLP